MTGYNERSIRRFTEELENENLVTVERKARTVNRYRLPATADMTSESARVSSDSGQDVRSMQDGMADKEDETNKRKENKTQRTSSEDTVSDSNMGHTSLLGTETVSSFPTEEAITGDAPLEDDATRLENLRLLPKNRGLTDEEILTRPDFGDQEAFNAWFSKKWRRQQADRKNQMDSVASARRQVHSPGRLCALRSI